MNMHGDRHVAKAFNYGSDARIGGSPDTANPYRDGPTQGSLETAWGRGWRHADEHWGADARHPFEVLPEVRW